MAQALTIPGGNDKGKPLTEASESSLKYWADRIGKSLEAGDSRFPDRDEALFAGLRAELMRRAGGQPSQNSETTSGAQKPPAQRPTQQQRPSQPSTALVHRRADDLAGSYCKPNEVTEALRLASQDMHLVAPATACGALPEGCEVAMSLVWVNSDATPRGPGDVFDSGGGKVGLAKATLDKIASAAAITWSSRESYRLDDGHDPLYCNFVAVGYLRNFDGSVRQIFGTKEMDLREDSEQIRALHEQYEVSMAKWKAGTSTAKYEPKSPDGQIRMMRLHIQAHAETKARLRAIRSIGIKSSYTADELKKPFAVARLMWSGRTDDPELRRMFALEQQKQMMNSTSMLFGPPPTATPGVPAPPTIRRGEVEYEPTRRHVTTHGEEVYEGEGYDPTIGQETEPKPADKASPQEPKSDPKPPAADQKQATLPIDQPPMREPGDEEDDLYPT